MIDGLGDVSMLSSGNPAIQTPMQMARTPYMDLLARHGHLGLMDPVEPGLACGSDTGMRCSITLAVPVLLFFIHSTRCLCSFSRVRSL